MADIFISYSRKDKEFVTKLHDCFLKDERDVWVDLEDIPDLHPDWLKQVYAGIEAANNFVFIISRDSIYSDICKQELTYAIENNKRIIGILYRKINNEDIKWLPPQLGKTNWFLAFQDTTFESAFERLNSAMDIDYDYVDKHTRILLHAKEWERKQYVSSLLSGEDLKNALSWIQTSKNEDKKPLPTTLMEQYIERSNTYQLEQEQKWDELYQSEKEQRLKANKTLAEQYKEQGRIELLDDNPMRAVIYLSEAYKMGLYEQSLKFLLSQAMRTVDAHLATLQGHTREVESVNFSPDGRTIVTSSSDNTAKIWEVPSAKLVTTLTGHVAPVLFAAFSPDYGYVVTAGKDKIVKIWDANTYKLKHNLRHPGTISLVAFSPDSLAIVTANGQYLSDEDSSIDSSVKVWEVTTGNLLLNLIGHTKQVSSVLYHPDGSKIFSGSLDGKIKVWDTRTGECLRTLDNNEGVFCLAISPDGTKLVAGGEKSKITLLDLITGGSKTLKAHLSLITHISFSADSNFFVTGSLDKSAVVWNSEDGTVINRLAGHHSSVTSVEFSPDASLLVTSSMDGNTKLWEAMSGRLVESLQGHLAEVLHARFSPDGTLLATGSWDNTTRLWDASNHSFLSFAESKNNVLLADFNRGSSRVATIGSEAGAKVWDSSNGVFLFNLHTNSTIEYIRFSPNGEYIVTAASDNTARVWNSTTGVLVAILEGHVDTVKFASFSSDTRIIATAGFDNTARIWETKTGKLLHTLNGHSSRVLSARFGPDNKHVLTASEDNTAKIWDIETGKLLFTLKHSGTVYTARYSPNGNYIITASQDKTAKIWNGVNGKLLRILEGHHGDVLSAEISPNNRYVVTASTDRTSKVWNIPDGSLINSLDDHEGFVWDAKFSPDNLFVITCGFEDKDAKIWEIGTGALLGRFENPAGATIFARFTPDYQRIVTSQIISVEMNPNVNTIDKTFSVSGSTVVLWRMEFEKRDPNQIISLVKRHIPFQLRGGRILPTVIS